jgi:hypothetical protein
VPGHVASSIDDEESVREPTDVAGPSYFEMWIDFVDALPEKGPAHALLNSPADETRKAWHALSPAQQSQVRFVRVALDTLVGGAKPETLGITINNERAA